MEDSNTPRNPSPPPVQKTEKSMVSASQKSESNAVGAAVKPKETFMKKPVYVSVSKSYHKLQFGMSSLGKTAAKPPEKKVPAAPVVQQVLDMDTSSDDETYNWQKEYQPDRSKSDYYCDVCDSHMNSEQMWVSHVSGKRHIRNMNKEPGVPASKVKAVKRFDSTPQIKKKLDKVYEPIVGLNYMCELQRSDTHVDPTYTCYLCHSTCTVLNVMEHLLSLKHRLAFLKEKDRSRYDMIQSMNLKKAALEALVLERVSEWEAVHGRGEMEVKLEKVKQVLPPPAKRRFDDYENDYLPTHKKTTYQDSVPSTSGYSNRRTPPRDSRTPPRHSGTPPRRTSPRHSRSPSRRTPPRDRRTSPLHHRSPLREVHGHWSPVRDFSSRSYRHSTDVNFNYIDPSMYPTHSRLQLLLKLSQPVIMTEMEAELVMKSVSSLTQSLMQYKIRNLPVHLQDRLARHIITGDTRELEQALCLDTNSMNNSFAQSSSNTSKVDQFLAMARCNAQSGDMISNDSVHSVNQQRSSASASAVRYEPTVPQRSVEPPMSGSAWVSSRNFLTSMLPPPPPPPDPAPATSWPSANTLVSYPQDSIRTNRQSWPRVLGNMDDSSSFGY